MHFDCDVPDTINKHVSWYQKMYDSKKFLKLTL